MKKLLITLSFLGTGTIVGAATLPTIVSCVPITHKQMIQQQLEKDYCAIHLEIKEKYENMSNEKVNDIFMNLALPENPKMNMTHGFDIWQWNTIQGYDFKEDKSGFERSVVWKGNSAKKDMSNTLDDELIENQRNFLIYDQTLRIIANDFNKYKSVFKSFYETKQIGDVLQWTSKDKSSTGISLDSFYEKENELFKDNKTGDENTWLNIINTLPLNEKFEQVVAFVVSLKNSALILQDIQNSRTVAEPLPDGLLNWVNKYWEYSYKLGFLPSNYESDSFTDILTMTNHMEVLRTELLDQNVNQTKSKYFHVKHDLGDKTIDEFINDNKNIDSLNNQYGIRWMNPKDLLDYFNGFINPLAIYGILNPLINVVKNINVIQQESPKIHLKFSKYLIDAINPGHISYVKVENEDGFHNAFGGGVVYTNLIGDSDSSQAYRFLDITQLNLVKAYWEVKEITKK